MGVMQSSEMIQFPVSVFIYFLVYSYPWEYLKVNFQYFETIGKKGIDTVSLLKSCSSFVFVIDGLSLFSKEFTILYSKGPICWWVLFLFLFSTTAFHPFSV